MSIVLRHLLKTHFGYDEFRDSQKAIIDQALQKKDSLVIMPTGGGKSLCYQLPAIALGGTTIVISPLIALMQDQVDALLANGIRAVALNSNTTRENINEIISNIGTEKLKLLYISPEKAVTSGFINLVRDKNISLIAIDEAHCVSIWGNDFRQEYTDLPALTRHFPETPIMALTATADKATQSDIAGKLKLKSPQLFISSFERKNLHLNVLPAGKRMDCILDFVKKRNEESGIIYCLSRKSTEMVADKLRNAGINARHYHAEMSASERNAVQRAFQQDEINVICATIAFGMGIDKSNVRYVLHYNLPKNLESYYQEIGRAGRDGLPSETVLFFSLGDAHILRQFIDKSQADESFKMVQRAKLNRMIEFCHATSCRTNMILSYFGEHRSDPCGHCDTCKNPPKQFDATIIAQKALSAVKRLNGKAAINMLVDVLRGSEKREILQLGFHQIKTFGAGADISRDDWLHYISQLINLGYLEIDFTDYNKLKLTTLSDQVLFRQYKVHLTRAQDVAAKDNAPQLTKNEQFNAALFEHLRQLRLTLAKMENIPAYAIFTDATLHEMCKARPMYMSDMEEIPGIGKHKLEKYAALFLDEIKKFIAESTTLKSIRGKTYLETYRLYKEGLTPEEIARMRNLNVYTIYSHFAYLFEKGEPIDITPYVTEDEINTVSAAWYKLKKTETVKEIFEFLEEKIEFFKIRLALAFLKKDGF